MPKVEFIARMFGKATKQAILNWQGMKDVAERVQLTGKPHSFVMPTKRGYVRVEIARWETRKTEEDRSGG